MEKKLRPYADISVVTGKYVKDGKERNRYHKIGTLFASPHLTNMTLKLDVYPVTSDGWCKIFKRDDWEEIQSTGDQITQEDIPEF